MRVRFDSRRQPQHDWNPLARRNDLAQKLELVLAVDDHRRAGVVCGFEVLSAFVVAEKVDEVLREARLQRDVQLARRHHIQPEPLLGDDAQELRRSEGLGRVKHLAGRAHGGHVFRGALPDRGLVIDVERRAVLPGQIDEIAAAHLHVAGGVHPVRDREQQASWLVRGGAAGAASASAAAAATLRAPEVERLG